MGLSTFLIFLAAYLVVRTAEKIFAIGYTVKADIDLKRLEKARAEETKKAVADLNKALKAYQKPGAVEPEEYLN